ncbi:MAG: cyclase family protein [Oscillospiraceae bacterium]
MDGPYHFNPDGPRLMELPMEYFCFDRVVAVDVPKGPGEGIDPADLKPWEDDIRRAESVAVKDRPLQNPGHTAAGLRGPRGILSPEVCKYLVETFPDLKVIGLDFLSVGTPANQLSKRAHRILFGCHNGKYIPAIEDIDLRPLFETRMPLKSVIVAPLRLGKVDSSQVTVIGEFGE